MCYWYNVSENVTNRFKDNGWTYNPIAVMNIITTAIKPDMSFDFYNKQNMCTLERNFNAMINKDKTLINK